jgi:MFS family permease
MLALNFAGFFIYIAGAPGFLIDLLGISTWGFAWLFVPMIAGIMIGAALSGRFAGHRSPRRTVHLGYSLVAIGVALNLLICWMLSPNVIWNVLPVFVFCIGTGVMMPSLMLMMLDLFPSMRGMASSLQGFVHFSLSGVVAAIVAPFLVQSLQALALGMLGAAVASFASGSLPAAGASRTSELGTMKRHSQRRSLAFTFIAFTQRCPLSRWELPATTLTIGKAKIVAEVAATTEQRTAGLMYRFSLKPDHG